MLVWWVKKGGKKYPAYSSFFPFSAPGRQVKTSVTFMMSRDFAGYSCFFAFTFSFICS